MTKIPPTPPANRSQKGPGEAALQKTDGHKAKPSGRPDNADAQGQQGNTKSNTTHQGHQQDR